MLVELSIENFALINNLTIRLGPGLNVLTGETGAGKSMIIDAISTLLGGKIEAETLRSGAKEGRIEGIFELDSERVEQIRPSLANHGVEVGEEGVAIICREIKRWGRGLARMNGRTVPLSFAKAVGSLLIDIHGQTEHLSLLEPREHLSLLDAYAGLTDLREEMAANYAELGVLERELSRLEKEKEFTEKGKELLDFQVREIESANLKPGEEEELQREREIVTNTERLKSCCDYAYRGLYESSGAVFDLLAQVKNELKKIVALDPDLGCQLQRIDGIACEVEDLARSLQSYVQRLEYDPERLCEIEERLELLGRLKKKYGNDISQVLAFAEDARVRLADAQSGEDERGRLEARLKQLKSDTAYTAGLLSVARRGACAKLVQSVEKELTPLNMAEVNFAISVNQQESTDGLLLPDGKSYAYDHTGIDLAEFLVSPNPGEPLKPLARIASGGEISRFMLALNCVLQMVNKKATLVFDEIDTGIGGRSADIIGKKLSQLGQGHQVLCITHLPQIACYADVHLRVSKEVRGGHTFIVVHRLEKTEEKVKEIADMLVGLELSEKAEGNAWEILVRAEEWKSRRVIGEQPLIACPQCAL